MIGIPTLLYDVLRAIVAIYLAILDPIWHLVVYYGLNPVYSYGLILDPGSAYYSLYRSITDLVYGTIIPVTLIVFSLFIAIRSLISSFRATRALLNLLIPFLAMAFAFRILVYLTMIFEDLFGYFWKYGGIDWYSIFSVTQISSFTSNGASSSIVLAFIYLTSYFFAITSLLAELIFREAAELLLMIIIPVFSSIAFIRKTQEYLIRAMATFVELAFLPIPIMMDLILAHIFSADPILELGFFILAPAIPSLIFVWMRNVSFRMQPIRIPMGMIGGFIGGQIDEMISTSKDRRIDWSEVYSKDTLYGRGNSG
ncbi:hypothetical membrane protein [Thermoplasma acidophilum]|uniref:Hypothetical membrane protein n=1 Tax=Thermoplasma acidophilum (strain ATCC 25905 / DSM 1728 / JCM 9062 / NBRC 15155 / AMRC-C165) TaxID=273075 RepID=Q9HKK5_THEAC|nr:hypothetical protein [Thermoplasma acidophilum]CAC11732.1 hypothetical membrane protein [Thermoplasma acidophilum]